MLNKTVFIFDEKEIKIRDLLILLLLFLLLFSLTMCREKNNNEKKQEVINTVVSESCKFYALNIEELSTLLIAANICEKEWYEELDDFIIRLKEQNVGLIIDGREGALEIENYQVKLVEALESFRKNSNQTTLDNLKEAYGQYATNYQAIKEACQK